MIGICWFLMLGDASLISLQEAEKGQEGISKEARDKYLETFSSKFNDTKILSQCYTYNIKEKHQKINFSLTRLNKVKLWSSLTIWKERL